MQTKQEVYVVDDDNTHRLLIRYLLHTIQLDVREHGRASDFLAAYQPQHPSCVIVDIRMPGMSGLDLCQKLRKQGQYAPIIMMTAYADVPLAVRAMKAGAFDFFEKPVNDQVLLDAVQKALLYDQKQREHNAEQNQLQQRMQALTPREKEVLQLLVQGESNKVIATQLDVGYKTIEAHRSRIIDKMQARNLADLVRMGIICRL